MNQAETLSTAKHTPGPWEARRALTNDGQQPIVGADRRVALADSQTDFKRGQGWNHDCAEREANAQLIAAAPDMLEALIAIREWLLDTDLIKKSDEHFWNGAFVKSNNLAIKAIAKATGGN